MNRKSQNEKQNTIDVAIGSRQKVNPSEVIQLCAEINYTHLYFDSRKKLTVSYTLKKVMDTLLLYEVFVRLNRSTVVNLRYIKYIEGNIVCLKNQEIIPVSRRRIKGIKGLLSNNFIDIIN